MLKNLYHVRCNSGWYGFRVIFFISEQSRQSALKSSKAADADSSTKKQMNPMKAVPDTQKASAVPYCQTNVCWISINTVDGVDYIVKNNKMLE